MIIIPPYCTVMVLTLLMTSVRSFRIALFLDADVGQGHPRISYVSRSDAGNCCMMSATADEENVGSYARFLGSIIRWLCRMGKLSRALFVSRSH